MWIASAAAAAAATTTTTTTTTTTISGDSSNTSCSMCPTLCIILLHLHALIHHPHQI